MEFAKSDHCRTEQDLIDRMADGEPPDWYWEQPDQMIVRYAGGAIGIQASADAQTVWIPPKVVLMAPELYQSVLDLLGFIKTFDMGGDWCQDNYPAIKHAKELLARL